MNLARGVRDGYRAAADMDDVVTDADLYWQRKLLLLWLLSMRQYRDRRMAEYPHLCG